MFPNLSQRAKRVNTVVSHWSNKEVSVTNTSTTWTIDSPFYDIKPVRFRGTAARLILGKRQLILDDSSTEVLKEARS